MSLEIAFDDVYPIAMIQAKNELLKDLEYLNSYISQDPISFGKLTKEQIWIAYERCGFDPTKILMYIEGKGNTEVIPFHITEEVWNNISPCRQVTFKTMFSNPNGFFYRNKPPGQQAFKGNWTEEEKIEFHKRFQLFEHFGFVNQKWGLFSVTLTRYGYSCAMFFKEYDPSQYSFVELPPFPDIPNESFENFLTDQAIDVIYQSIKEIETLDPTSLLPVDVRCANQDPKQKIRFREKEKEKNKPAENKEKEVDKNTNMKKSASAQVVFKKKNKADDFLKTLDNSELNVEKPDTTSLSYSQSAVFDKKKKKKNKPEKPKKKNIHPPPPQDDVNLTFGAIDAVTRLPMRKPAMSREGYVFDLTTWHEIINGHIECPFVIAPLTANDLIPLTDENFALYKPFIRNVSF